MLIAPAAGAPARRALLRALCARALGLDPADVLVAHAPGRRPRLVRPEGTGLVLSAGSRAGLAAVAAARARLGVDVEVGDGPIPWNVLHPDEAEALRAAPGPEAFAALWAVKEAYLKALGLGLSREPSGFAVLMEATGPRILDPGGPAASAWVGWHGVAGRRAAVAAVLLADG